MEAGFKVIKIAARKRERDAQSKFGGDFCRMLAEIITNSDDSYRNLERHSTDEEYKKSIKPIYITLKFNKHKNCHEFIVVDNAEGMDKSTLNKVFEAYGADTTHGIEGGARGLYGQGATDVIDVAKLDGKTAYVKSIKDGKLCSVNFTLDEDQSLGFEVEEENLSQRDLTNFRAKYKIPLNGTIVYFGLPDSIRLPKSDDEIIEEIQKFPQFRYILKSSNNRSVVLTFSRKNSESISHHLISDSYCFNESDFLQKQVFEFKNDDDIIKGSISFYKNANKVSNETNFLVIDDENNVYDNADFGFVNLKALNISGIVHIYNFYGLCKERLNRAKNKEAIVLDNRTGFNTKKSFYVDLVHCLYPKIKTVLDEYDASEKDLSLTKNKRFSKALQSVNKYLNSLLEEDDGAGTLKGLKAPLEGIKFHPTIIQTTIGKGYGLKLLINTDLVPLNSLINIQCETLNHIEFSPANFVLLENDLFESDTGVENLAVKNIHIDSLVETIEPLVMIARANNLETSVIINVVPEDIYYPQNGMEFHPNSVFVVPGVKHTAHLYIDTDVIPLESKIDVFSPTLMQQSVELEIENSQLIGTSKIAKIDVEFGDGVVGSKHQISARNTSLNAVLDIEFIEGREISHGKRGLISDFKIEHTPHEVPYQSWFNENDGVLSIAQENKINKVLFNNFDGIDFTNPSFNKEERKIVADIVSFELAKYAVNALVKKGKIPIEEGNTNDYLYKIQEYKNDIFGVFYNALTNK